MGKKALNPKDFVLPTKANWSGAVIPANTFWHDADTLKPVDRPLPEKKQLSFNYYLFPESEVI